MILFKINFITIFFLLYSNYVSCMESERSLQEKKLALLQSYRKQSLIKQIETYEFFKKNPENAPYLEEVFPPMGEPILDKIGIGQNTPAEKTWVYVLKQNIGKKDPSFSRYTLTSREEIGSLELPVEAQDLYYFDLSMLDILDQKKVAICATALSGHNSSRNTFIVDLKKNSIDYQLPLNCSSVAIYTAYAEPSIIKLAGATVHSNEIVLVNSFEKPLLGGSKYTQIMDSQTLCAYKHTDMVNSLAADKWNRLLASGSNDKTVKLWNLCTPQCKYTYDIGSEVKAVRFDPDGNNIISTAEKSSDILDVQTGKKITQLEDSGFKVWCWNYPRAACSNDGNLIAQVIGVPGNNSTIINQLRIWDKKTGKIVFERGHGDGRKYLFGNNGAASFDSRDEIISLVTNFPFSNQHFNQTLQYCFNLKN